MPHFLFSQPADAKNSATKFCSEELFLKTTILQYISWSDDKTWKRRGRTVRKREETRLRQSPLTCWFDPDRRCSWRYGSTSTWTESIKLDALKIAIMIAPCHLHHQHNPRIHPRSTTPRPESPLGSWGRRRFTFHGPTDKDKYDCKGRPMNHWSWVRGNMKNTQNAPTKVKSHRSTLRRRLHPDGF